VNITEFGTRLFLSETTKGQMRKEGEANRQMSDDFIEVFKDRSMFERSLRRYEQWKNKDILALVLETMPKQAKRKNSDNFAKLRTESRKKLTGESR